MRSVDARNTEVMRASPSSFDPSDEYQAWIAPVDHQCAGQVLCALAAMTSAGFGGGQGKPAALSRSMT